MWVTRIDAKLTQARQREAEQARAAAVREAERPAWLLDYGLNRDRPPVGVHVGDCRMAGQRSKGIDADVARQALAAGVSACTVCRPDTELGMLEQ
ncbi:hypothetical protein D0Z67_29325 (plasmid) [Streptomyces seoulensis]|uniref:Uncharacterized protein n=2 Tax=Streptomyces seoulensis TaxID=73044 RepID=A0A4P6U5B0_STRSO|nr:hypothetical protein D0Z67_29325 [Streptomyces seoulensis]